MTTSVRLVKFTLGKERYDIALGRCRLNSLNQVSMARRATPPGILQLYRQWSDNITAPVVNQNQIVQLCDILKQAFGAIHPLRNQNGEVNEKLALMFIDGALTLGDNLLATAREFNKCHITLAIVAVSALPFNVWNYYRTLAEKTRGAFILVKNVKTILSNVMLSVLNGADTLGQAFRQVYIADLRLVNDRVEENYEQNQVSDGVGDLAFDHGLDK